MSSPKPEPEPRTSRVPVARLRIHNRIVDHLGLSSGDVLVDVGCGTGLTMATAASRVAGIFLIGIDVDGAALKAAASWLDELGGRYGLVRADLDAPIPVADGSVNHVVCHDVLECLADPGALLAEAHRVLRPGGTAVWSHVDYESAVVAGADRELTRAVLRAYAEAPAAGGRRSNSQMGRSLTAVVARSPLVRTTVDAQVLLATDLSGPGAFRIDDIRATVRRAGGGLAPEDVDGWVAQLRHADERGEFFYSQTAYIVVARRA